MKKQHVFTLGLFYFLLLLTITGFAPKTNHTTQEDASIVGTWISEEDTNWKMVFTTSKCKWFYENIQTEEFNYLLSNTTPQCGETVSITVHTEYLQITNSADPNDKTCYEVFGISMESLSIRMIGSGKLLVFDRQ